MDDFDAAKAVGLSDAAQLSKILELEAAPSAEWTEQDLPAMLRHQMSAPLEIDLTSFPSSGRAAWDREHTRTQAKDSTIRTFDDLLFHRAPPFSLLSLSKKFFKARTLACKKNSADWKLAFLFYLLTLLVARDRASKLTALSPEDLLAGTAWAIEQAWVDERTKQLILSTRHHLTERE